MLNKNKETLRNLENTKEVLQEMNQKLRLMTMIMLCVFSIITAGTIVLDEKEEPVEIVTDVRVNENGYLCAGVALSMAEAIDAAENNMVSLEEIDRVQVRDSYYEEEPVESEEEEPEMRFEEVPKDYITYVYVDLLNLRSGATTDSEVLTVLNYGTELQVIGEMNIYINDELIDHWTHVRYQDYTGYLKSDYLIDEPPYYSLGVYDITYYCPCAICCGVETGITASGAVATAGVTCAADGSIPFGTELIIDGHTYIVQDRGGAIKGNHIDIFCNTHEEALNRARRNAEVFMKIDID